MAQARIPSLDGLRAISIAFVLAQHSVASTGSNVELYTANFARLGVWIFFVISGFIITTLLLREAERGPISLIGFYLRRAFRLLPALAAFLIFLAVVQALGANLGVDPIHYFAGAFFLVPYVPWGAANHPWSTGHLWSLAVEEHFYLLWPPLLAGLGVRRAKWALVAFVVIVPFCRAIWYKLQLDPLGTSLLGLGDLMAYGALAAIWHHRSPERVLRFLAYQPTLVRILACSVILFNMVLRITETAAILTVPFGLTAVGLAIAYLLLSVCFEPERRSIAFRVLNLPAVAWVGSLSYSLYVWQQPFLHKIRDNAEWWQQFPQNLGFAVLAAVASFYLVERPCLKWKSRLF